MTVNIRNKLYATIEHSLLSNKKVLSVFKALKFLVLREPEKKLLSLYSPI